MAIKRNTKTMTIRKNTKTMVIRKNTKPCQSQGIEKKHKTTTIKRVTKLR
jgi:hypothetical protein